jgi:hypothetical protein
LPAAPSRRSWNGMESSRRPSGAGRQHEFLSRHGKLIVASDLFTVEAWTRRGLQRFIILFFIDLSTRKVEIAGLAPVANGLWMSQIARNLTDSEDGILTGKRYLIHDRDPLFTAEFLNRIADAGVESVKLPRSPNRNAYAERFVRSIQESCLDRMILFGGGVVADSHTEPRRSLSQRAQSPRSGEPTPQPRAWPSRQRR